MYAVISLVPTAHQYTLRLHSYATYALFFWMFVMPNGPSI